MTKTIRGDRLHIAILGRMNAGKSSLINALTSQNVAIVSSVPGTTTDPVYKSMELAPIGPVVLIDTAGMDDFSDALGDERIKRSEKILKKTDVAIVVIDAESKELTFENSLINLIDKENIPYITVINKIDLKISGSVKEWIKEKTFIRVSSKTSEGIELLKKKIIEVAPESWEPPFMRDLIRPGDIVMLVTPIDLGAPKGRLIMPQVKALRDILDADAIPLMCKEREILPAFNSLRKKPSLVVTDSQVFPEVAAKVPVDVLLTSFSILSIRQKGNLAEMVQGVLSAENLRKGDKVLIAESCSHHPLEDDIGRIKIPRWLNAKVGGGLEIDTAPGSAFPENLSEYKLVVHCGACTLNRKEMLRRQKEVSDANVAMTNYGILISWMKCVFPRALKPFPELYSMFTAKENIKDIKNTKKMAEITDI